ncbi:MAG TPA: hypothetical protein VFB54_13015 [Burkholderiales bacterium]|nr:hypothetical protein [Burkholderiales bacterium]
MPFAYTRLCLPALGLLGACAVTPAPTYSTDHPANPAAASAPSITDTSPLTSFELPAGAAGHAVRKAPAPTQRSPEAEDEHAHHHH